jgi:hypothetical protein
MIATKDLTDVNSPNIIIKNCGGLLVRSAIRLGAVLGCLSLSTVFITLFFVPALDPVARALLGIFFGYLLLVMLALVVMDLFMPAAKEAPKVPVSATARIWSRSETGCNDVVVEARFRLARNTTVLMVDLFSDLHGRPGCLLGSLTLAREEAADENVQVWQATVSDIYAPHPVRGDRYHLKCTVGRTTLL